MIEVILINWKRPENVAIIAEAFRAQSVPCKLKLCDVSTEDFRIPARTRNLFDEVFTWDRNYGCYNRFVIVMSVQSETLWFHDDDMKPGPHFVAFLESQNLEGGVGSQRGNRVMGEYYQDVPRTAETQRVDFNCRGYYLRTEDTHYVHTFMNRFQLWDYSKHDDILMAKAIQFYTGRCAQLFPSSEPETSMNIENLPEPHSCWRSPEHRPMRIKLLERLREIFAAHGKVFEAMPSREHGHEGEGTALSGVGL